MCMHGVWRRNGFIAVCNSHTLFIFPLAANAGILTICFIFPLSDSRVPKSMTCVCTPHTYARTHFTFNSMWSAPDVKQPITVPDGMGLTALLPEYSIYVVGSCVRVYVSSIARSPVAPRTSGVWKVGRTSYESTSQVRSRGRMCFASAGAVGRPAAIPARVNFGHPLGESLRIATLTCGRTTCLSYR